MENENELQSTAKTRSALPMRIVKIVLAVLILAAVFYFGFTFEVREGNCAVVLRFGAPRKEITDAGLYLRLPWPFENVVTYESRLQYLESNYLETTTKDKRNVILQSYVVWRVDQPLLYHNSVGASGSVASYIKDQVFSATNSVLGSYELSNIVSLDAEKIRTEEIQQKIFEAVRANCEQNYGISVVDVSVLRLSLPDTNLQSVFEQMEADRQKDIETIIANAERDANKITSDADVEAAQIRADGVTQAAQIRAKTETEVAKIYAEAQAANLELYKFLKELDAISASVGDSTVLVVNTDTYPFNMLTEYSGLIDAEEGATDKRIIDDLTYLLTQVPEDVRQELITGIFQLIANVQKAGQ